ncbi:hypothetical protein DFH08DRAFT_1000680 [Mycena albidolilacea]|uniref:Uncharacterized protein n=1 Tax=Mycena albidolilacea TaxID=1033008 RepID=A0AAD7A3N0_9AGAR|nr:hypothetical protein DFH08DRAFT_1000680 [Mycena albidolilacea]
MSKHEQVKVQGNWPELEETSKKSWILLEWKQKDREGYKCGAEFFSAFNAPIAFGNPILITWAQALGTIAKTPRKNKRKPGDTTFPTISVFPKLKNRQALYKHHGLLLMRVNIKYAPSERDPLEVPRSSFTNHGQSYHTNPTPSHLFPSRAGNSVAWRPLALTVPPPSAPVGTCTARFGPIPAVPAKEKNEKPATIIRRSRTLDGISCGCDERVCHILLENALRTRSQVARTYGEYPRAPTVLGQFQRGIPKLALCAGLCAARLKDNNGCQDAGPRKCGEAGSRADQDRLKAHRWGDELMKFITFSWQSVIYANQIASQISCGKKIWPLRADIWRVYAQWRPATQNNNMTYGADRHEIPGQAAGAPDLELEDLRRIDLTAHGVRSEKHRTTDAAQQQRRGFL